MARAPKVTRPSKRQIDRALEQTYRELRHGPIVPVAVPSIRQVPARPVPAPNIAPPPPPNIVPERELPRIENDDNAKILTAVYTPLSGSTPEVREYQLLAPAVQFNPSGTLADDLFLRGTGSDSYGWEAFAPREVPAVGSSDDDKFLTASYSGGSGSYGWETYTPPSVREVTAVGSDDNDRVLTASYDTSTSTGSYDWEAIPTQFDPQGTLAARKVLAGLDSSSYGWETISLREVPTIDSNDNDLYLKASYDSSDNTTSYDWASLPTVSGFSPGGTLADNVFLRGTSSSAYSWESYSPDEVPTVGSSDNDKILTASYSGGSGSYAWEAPGTYFSPTGTLAQRKILAGTSNTEYGWADLNTRDVTVVTSNDNDRVLTASHDGSAGSYGWEDLPATRGVPAVGSSDDDKVLTAAYDSGTSTASYSWETLPTDGNVPAPRTADDEKVLTATVDINNNPGYGWYLIRFPTRRNVPTVGSSDDDKVLTAAYDTSTSTGSYAWETPPTITGTVPDVGSSDDDKVLTAAYDSSTSTGSYSWETLPAPTGTVPDVGTGDDNKLLTASYDDTTSTGSYAWERLTGRFVPGPSLGEYGFVLTALPDRNDLRRYDWREVPATRAVPAVESSDDDKVLTAAYDTSTSTGSYSWEALPTTTGFSPSGTLADNVFLRGTSSSAYGWESYSPSVVPAVDSGDDDKVLTASHDGSAGSYGWEDLPATTSFSPTGTLADNVFLRGTSSSEYGWESYAPSEVPTVGSNDDGKFLTASYSAGSGSYAWATYTPPTVREVPTVGSSDDDKFLRAAYDSSTSTGSYAWETYTPPTVRAVPAVGSTDNIKYLKASYSSGTGSYAWDTIGERTPISGSYLRYRRIDPDDNNSPFAPVWTNHEGYVRADDMGMSGSDHATHGPHLWFNDVWSDSTSPYTNITSSGEAGGHIFLHSAATPVFRYSRSIDDPNNALTGTKLDDFQMGYPIPGSSDSGKVLTAPSSGFIPTWETLPVVTNTVPTVGSSDDDKVLTATYSGGSGSYAWETPAVGFSPSGTLADDVFLRGTSSTAYGWEAFTPRQVPDIESADNNLFLRAAYDSSTSTGSYDWASTPSASGFNPGGTLANAKVLIGSSATAYGWDTAGAVPTNYAPDGYVLTIHGATLGYGYRWESPASSSLLASRIVPTFNAATNEGHVLKIVSGVPTWAAP